MPEPTRNWDQLLTGEIGRAAGDAAGVPDFDELVTRGRRRARTRRTAVAGAVALAVVGVVGVIQLVGSNDREGQPAPVAPSQSESPKQPDRSDLIDWKQPDAAAAQEAAAVIDDPAATVSAGAVDPGEPGVRIVRWQVCDDPCRELRQAIAVTGDAFTTRLSLPDSEYGRMVPAGNGVFVVETLEPGEPPVLISARGTSAARLEHAVSPLKEGEVLVALHGSGVPVLGLLAVDPVTGTGHPIPSPGRDIRNWSQLGTTLTVQVGGETLRNSANGGGRWTTESVPDPGNAFTWLVDSADPGTRAMLYGGDGSEYPTLEMAVRIHGYPDPETHPYDTGPWAAFSGSYVLPDGRLLLAVNAWSDESEHAEGEQGTEVTPSGVYVSTEDWSSLAQVPGVADGAAPLGSFITAADGSPSLVVTPQGGNGLVFSSDGESWATLSAR